MTFTSSKLYVNGAFLLLGVLSLSCLVPLADAEPLVSQETIETQEQQTSITKLPNGIPLIYRQDTSSSLMHMIVTFDGGIRDLPAGEKSQVQLLFGVMSRATQSMDREQVNAFVEKYALQIGCGAGIEYSSCEVGTVEDYWIEGLQLLTDMILSPALAESDFKLEKDRSIFGLKRSIEDPGRYVNEVVNRVYYPQDHPFYLPVEANIKEFESLQLEQLRTVYQDMIDAQRMTITVVGSLPFDQVRSDVVNRFGAIEAKERQRITAPKPQFDAKRAFAFEHRQIPTAYIRLKFNGVSVGDPDEVAAQLMFKILDEELSEEIRTRRSLSYSIHSYMISNAIGVGVILASTSQPQQTLAAMTEVIGRMQARHLDSETLEEYKTVYATSYFLTMEQHSSLAAAMSSSYYYRGSLEHFFRRPLRLGEVTSEQVQKAAQRLLRNISVGVVYDQDKFDPRWAQDLIQKTSRQ